MSICNLAPNVRGSRSGRKHLSLGAQPTFVAVHAHHLPEFYVEIMRSVQIHDMDGWPIHCHSMQAFLCGGRQ